MNRRHRIRAITAIALSGVAMTSAFAQDCTVPEDFDRKVSSMSVINWFGDAATPCKLRSQLVSTTDAMAAGFVPYPFPGGAQQVRLRFAFDASLLSVGTVNRSAGIVTIGGTEVVLSGAFVTKVNLMGQPGAGGGKQLRVVLPQPSDMVTGYQMVDIPLGNVTGAEVGLDLQLGTSGYLSYWINAGFDAPPTGRIPASGYLDFSARGAATGLALGLFSSSSAFRNDNLAKDLVFSDITVTDYIFRSR